jgi:hypothetical protein
MGEGRIVYRLLVEKPEGKRPLARPRFRWEDNIKVDLQEVGCRGMVAGACECGDEPSGSIKWGEILTSCEPVSFSRRILLHGVSE